VASPFSSPGPLVRIDFKYLGEYSKQMFSDMGRSPGHSPLTSFSDGSEFSLVRSSYSACLSCRVLRNCEMFIVWTVLLLCHAFEPLSTMSLLILHAPVEHLVII
jgi:hypothetical protein